MADLPAQPEVETACPACGAEPTDESLVRHRLSSMGYDHDDQMFECEAPDCNEEWCHGVPIGESDPFDGDLRCENPRCEREWCLVHRVELVHPGGDLAFKLHKKCPECYFFGFARRYPDGAELSLVGYPQITGNTDGAKPYGYTDDALDDGPACDEPACIEHGNGTVGCPLDD